MYHGTWIVLIQKLQARLGRCLTEKRGRVVFWCLSMMAAGALVLFMTQTASATPCRCTVFSSDPAAFTSNDAGGIEVGFKFKSDMAGYVTGVRFYKTAGMIGAHTGHLWDLNGNLLATVAFTGETASGWQEARFSSPVAVTANTIYTASMFAADGNYAYTSNYYTSEVVNLPLRAPADGAALDGLGNSGQGVFSSADTSAYPSSSFNKSNYWVDVAFFDTTAPAVTVATPSDGATGVNVGATISATFDQDMNPATLTSTFAVRDPANSPVAGTVSYNSATKTVAFVATEGLDTNKTYTATIEGGSGTVAKNLAGIALPNDYSWTFTTSGTNACPCSLKNRANPAGSSTFDEIGSLELGVKIKPSANGYITALRFYKPIISTETTHTGNIWGASGTKLAAVTFTDETDYGWQEAKLNTPLSVSQGQLYIVSYGTTTAIYQSSVGGLNSDVVSGSLTAYADNSTENAATGSGNRNGVFNTTADNYPGNGTINGSYYWVDAVFSVTSVPADPLMVQTTQPANNAYGAARDRAITASFQRALDGATVTSSTVRLFDNSNGQVAGTASYDGGSHSVRFMPASPLGYGGWYTMRLSGTITDTSGRSLGSEYTWSFTVGSQLSGNPNQGPGGPILVVTSSANKYSAYYAEILRAEGLNYFDVKDISTVDGAILNNYDAVILSEMTLTQSQADLFNAWTQGGGNLIAMRPDKKLAGLLGLTDTGSTRSNEYLLMNTASTPGAGLVGETIQFKGAADNYTLNGATAVATFYSDAATGTANPAATVRSIGSNGGTAAAFTYDLAKSVIALHQGNQAWVGQNRDGNSPVRTNDLFFGAMTGDVQPDWVDLNKIHIPQADEQQRLLANIITESTKDHRPLPRFWYLPHDYKAALVMAGDDHNLSDGVGTERTISNWLNESPTNCLVADWGCVRASHYVYVGSALTNSRALQYSNLGFEVGDHVSTTCGNFASYAGLETEYASDLAAWRAKFTSLPNQRTHRYHCYVWSDWDSQPRVEYNNGIRYELNYVAYPGSWMNGRAPLMTGSGMNMRLTDANGDLLDVHQGVTNFDDQTSSAAAIDALLDNAVGTAGYWGIFGTHYDMSNSYSTTLFNAAKARNIPMISSEQALTWLDGRDSSAFSNFGGGAGQFTFNITAAVGANGLRAMMPMQDAGGTLTGIKLGGAPVAYQTQTIKGIAYAVFDGAPGSYTVTYSDYSAPSSGSGSSNASGRTQAPPAGSVFNPAEPTNLIETSDDTPGKAAAPDKTTTPADKTQDDTQPQWLGWALAGGALAAVMVIGSFWAIARYRRRKMLSIAG